MTDELDSKTDAELSEIFAVEVSAFTDCEIIDGMYGQIKVPEYSTDSNAVLPWLEKNIPEKYETTYPFGGWFVYSSFDEGKWLVSLAHNGHYEFHAAAKTFARAACIALIRAKRAEKGGGK
jgi:hypothetical protein